MSTRDELLAAAEWFEEVADFHVIPAIIAKEKLAATALREKASAAEGFEAWADSDGDNDPWRGDYNHKGILFYAERAYAAGRAAASERVAELERERALLVAEVRRCWGLVAADSSNNSTLGCIESDRPAEVRAIVEAQP